MAISTIAAILLSLVPIMGSIIIAHICVKSCGRKSQRPKASSANPIAYSDPVPKEASAPKVINTQLEPSNEDIKGTSDEEAFPLSTMPDLPTTPMRVYDPNDPSTFPEPQDDLYTRGVASLKTFGRYRGTANTPMLANMHVLPLSWPQGHSGLPTFPESRYDQYSRSVPQDCFGQYQSTGNTLRQTDMQVSRPQGHSDLPTLPESQDEPYSPNVSPQVISGRPRIPEPQDGPYSPNVSPRAIFGQRRGTGNTLPNFRGSRPLGYKGFPTF